MRRLTKSMLASTARCRKRAWLSVHGPALDDPDVAANRGFLLGVGARLSQKVTTYFGPGVNLSGELDMQRAVSRTYDALADPATAVIYEATFCAEDVLVRVDVLRRAAPGAHAWDLIEVKSTSAVRADHLLDLAIQRAVLLKDESVELNKCVLASLNKGFVLDKTLPDPYAGMLIEHVFDADGQPEPSVEPEPEAGKENEKEKAKTTTKKKRAEKVDEEEDLSLPSVEVVDALIEQLREDLEDAEACPPVAVGNHCKQPFGCEFQSLCDAPKAEVPIRIIPYVGKKLEAEWAERGVFDLRDVPRESLKKPAHRIIWDAHTTGTEFRSDTVAAEVKALGWPRYSMDFESVQQTVPLVAGTRPRDALPFQWAVHKWERPEQRLVLEDAASFLEFDKDDMRVRFLESLIACVGEEGPIFVHHIAAERTMLQKLLQYDDCKHFEPQVRAILDRCHDTLKICRDHFYSPKMMGSYSLKAVIKAIDTDIVYDAGDGAVGNGQDAQTAWFLCTDPAVSAHEKERVRRELIAYCAKDTLALVHLLQYLSR